MLPPRIWSVLRFLVVRLYLFMVNTEPGIYLGGLKL
jgi:hypothetical protein